MRRLSVKKKTQELIGGVIYGRGEMDAVDFRRKNVIKEGEENLRVETTHSIGAEGCLDKVAERIEWGRPWKGLFAPCAGARA